jgi:hypothetical protein
LAFFTFFAFPAGPAAGVFPFFCGSEIDCLGFFDPPGVGLADDLDAGFDEDDEEATVGRAELPVIGVFRPGAGAPDGFFRMDFGGAMMGVFV